MFFNQIFQWFDYKNTSENRALAKFPKANYKQLDKYPGEFDAYLQDNFTFRAPFLKAYHELMFKMDISPDPQRVIIGSHDHLFHAGTDLLVYENKYPFDKKKLHQLYLIVKEKEDYLNQKNIPSYWLICPFKLHIYDDYLPFNVHERGGNRSLKAIKYLSKYYPQLIIYPLDVIKKDKDEAYYKYDNHWTQKGAYYGYKELMKVIQRNNPAIKALSSDDILWKKDTSDQANLLNFIGKENDLTELVPQAIVKHSPDQQDSGFGFKPTPGFPYPSDYECYFKNPTALNKKKILVITDSFGRGLHSFISATFSESLFIFNAWQYNISKEIMDTYKPDMVIFVTMEGLLGNVLDYPAIIE
jgi:hypothetical protein